MGELTFNDPGEVEGADDVQLPRYAHHLKIRSELTGLVELDKLSNDEADALYDEWRADRT